MSEPAKRDLEPDEQTLLDQAQRKLEAARAEIQKRSSNQTPAPLFADLLTKRETCCKCGAALPADRWMQCETCDAGLDSLWAQKVRWEHGLAIDSLIKRCGVPDAYASGQRSIDNVRDPDAAALSQAVVAGELRGLYVSGEAGPDKTTLVASTLVSWIRAGGACQCATPTRGECEIRNGLYAAMVDVKTDVLATYSKGAELSRADIVKLLMDAPMLVLDEFDKAGDSEHTIEVVFQILDGRYRQIKAGAKRPLILAANYSLDALCDRWARRMTTEDVRGMIEPIKRRIVEMTANVEMKL